MTLCLANALSWDTPPNMDLRRQLAFYLRWRNEGWCSSNGRCFDIGNQTAQALAKFDATASLVAPEAPQGQGNGALMRAVPVPIWLLPWHLNEPQIMAGQSVAGADQDLGGRQATLLNSLVRDDARFPVRASAYAQACATTHNNPVCIAAAVIYSELVLSALFGLSRQQLLDQGTKLVSRAQEHHPEFGHVRQALTGDVFWEQLKPTGWVIHSLAIACWALRSFENFEEGLIEVVNLRGDADTNGAIYGGLAGACFGIDAFPKKWRRRLKHQEQLADALEATIARASH
jgi:ADP-ribosyl-[dinitrogen reductase] hydrolase